LLEWNLYTLLYPIAMEILFNIFLTLGKTLNPKELFTVSSTLVSNELPDKRICIEESITWSNWLLECNIFALLCLIAMVILLIVFLTLEKNNLLTE
jgi:hypothetical protein